VDAIVSQNSLSLFDDSPDDAVDEASTVAAAVAAQARSERSRDTQKRHLLAARRLSRRMTRFADQSPEQLRAGRQICRHLVAMLKEVETAPRTH